MKKHTDGHTAEVQLQNLQVCQIFILINLNLNKLYDRKDKKSIKNNMLYVRGTD
jgi:hypothetical protein